MNVHDQVQMSDYEVSTTGWDERALLLLGVLKSQNQHGYQINDFIERSLCNVTTMKKPTSYALLDRLAGAGFVTIHREQAGNRPPRKIFALTAAGHQLFDDLLLQNLASVDLSTYAGDVGLMFLNHLDRHQALAALRQRLDKIDALLADDHHIPSHGDVVRLDLANDHVMALRRADRDWLAETILRLEGESNARVSRR